MREVWITGVGIIAPVGNHLPEVLSSLHHLRGGIIPSNLISPGLSHIPVAPVRASDEALTNRTISASAEPDAPGGYALTDTTQVLSRTTLLGFEAATQAIRQAGLSQEALSEMPVVSATTVSGMKLAEQFLLQGEINGPLAHVVPAFDCGDTAEVIARHYRMCMATTISTACSSSANAILTGARYILNGLYDRVLVGGADSLSRFTLHGFNALELLSPTGCRPFDAERNGVTIGEGSAFLVLESSRKADRSKALARLSGFANCNEAFHFTASSPDGRGAAATMTEALNMAGLSPGDIGYINAHGTGTIINDLSEGRAISSVFGVHIPQVSSTKGYTGHTLGAAGAIEAVISLLALQEQCSWPNLGWSEPMEELGFHPATTCMQLPLRNVMSNSFGFGGNNVSIIFSAL